MELLRFKQTNDFSLSDAKGLSSAEVREKQKLFGRNEVAEKQASSRFGFCQEVLGFSGLDA